MNYEEMSDLEIAARVLHGRGVPHKIEHQTCFIDHGFEDGECVYTAFDPCNSASDSWDLMVSNEISLVTLGDEWEAHHLDDYGNESNNIVQARPGRAVSICFLKMKDAENGNN